MDNTTLPIGIREQWPWQPRFARVNGWRMHYIDEGTGDPVVLLHGNPTWGFLYRDFVEPLMRAGHRVVIPDMIGFGLSEKPTREEAHSLNGHIANLTQLLRQLDLRRITLICHDWGGPTGLSFALSNPSRVAALVVMSTWAWPLPPAEFHTRIFPWRMMHAPLIGPYLLGRHNALAGRGVYLSVVDREKFRKRAQQAYEWALPDPANSRRGSPSIGRRAPLQTFSACDYRSSASLRPAAPLHRSGSSGCSRSNPYCESAPSGLCLRP